MNIIGVIILRIKLPKKIAEISLLFLWVTFCICFFKPIKIIVPKTDKIFPREYEKPKDSGEPLKVDEINLKKEPNYNKYPSRFKKTKAISLSLNVRLGNIVPSLSSSLSKNYSLIN